MSSILIFLVPLSILVFVIYIDNKILKYYKDLRRNDKNINFFYTYFSGVFKYGYLIIIFLLISIGLCMGGYTFDGGYY